MKQDHVLNGNMKVMFYKHTVDHYDRTSVKSASNVPVSN